MVTKLIGLKEFRMNLSKILKQTNQKGVRFIVLKKNVPVLKVEGLSKKDAVLETLVADIAEAREQIKKGKTTSHKDMKKRFGL